MMRYSDDPAADWDAYCIDQEREREHLPMCIECDQYIEDDRCWDFGDGPMCDECAERQYRKWTADLME